MSQDSETVDTVVVAPAETVRKAPPSGGKRLAVMPGGAKKLGKGVPSGAVAKRHSQAKLRGNLAGITDPSIRRLARKGGIKRINGLVYDEVRNEVLTPYLKRIIGDAIAYTEHAHRKTLSLQDVVYSLKRNGQTLYMGRLQAGRQAAIGY